MDHFHQSGYAHPRFHDPNDADNPMIGSGFVYPENNTYSHSVYPFDIHETNLQQGAYAHQLHPHHPHHSHHPHAHHSYDPHLYNSMMEMEQSANHQSHMIQLDQPGNFSLPMSLPMNSMGQMSMSQHMYDPSRMSRDQVDLGKIHEKDIKLTVPRFKQKQDYGNDEDETVDKKFQKVEKKIRVLKHEDLLKLITDIARSSAEARKVFGRQLRQIRVKKRVGEKTIVCDHPGCGRRYYYPTDLRYHKLRCHTKDQDKPFPCPVEGCGKRFSENAALQVHLRIHTGQRPYVCTYSGCNKSFSQSGNLRNHMRTHSDERPYKCDRPGCIKSYKSPQALKSHLRSHESVKSVICEYPGCNKAFKDVRTLRRHKESRHSNVIDQSVGQMMQSMYSFPSQGTMSKLVPIINSSMSQGMPQGLVQNVVVSSMIQPGHAMMVSMNPAISNPALNQDTSSNSNHM